MFFTTTTVLHLWPLISSIRWRSFGSDQIEGKLLCKGLTSAVFIWRINMNENSVFPQNEAWILSLFDEAAPGNFRVFHFAGNEVKFPVQRHDEPVGHWWRCGATSLSITCTLANNPKFKNSVKSLLKSRVNEIHTFIRPHEVGWDLFFKGKLFSAATRRIKLMHFYKTCLVQL